MNRGDYESACAGFRWPELDEFNWVLEWFDHLGVAPGSAQRDALHIIDPDDSQRMRCRPSPTSPAASWPTPA